jgi:hypothetical protein
MCLLNNRSRQQSRSYTSYLAESLNNLFQYVHESHDIPLVGATKAWTLPGRPVVFDNEFGPELKDVVVDKLELEDESMDCVRAMIRSRSRILSLYTRFSSWSLATDTTPYAHCCSFPRPKQTWQTGRSPSHLCI